MTAEPTKASSESARELSRNHETLKMLLNGVTDYAIFMIDPAGIVLTWNTGAARLKGYPADEIIGQHFSRFYTQDAITTGHPERELQIAKAEGRYEEEGWRVRKDGTSFWANVVISPVFENNVLIGYAKITRDLTERQQAQQASARQEAIFRSLVSGVKDYAIFMLSPEGNVMTWNEGAQYIKGYSAQEIIGKHFSMFYTQADRDSKHPEHELETAQKEGQYEEEGWRVRKDGNTFWAGVLITPIYNGSKLVGFSKVTRDLTERRYAEQSREAAARVLSETNEELGRALEVKTRFLSTISHEVRTPMGGIIGMAELLTLTDLGKDNNSIVRAIFDSSNRLLALLNDMLDAARMESGKLKIEFRPFPVRTILGDVQQLIQPEASKKNLSITVSCDPALPEIICGDEIRLRQVLLNLAFNAVKFTQSGGVSINCTMTEQSANDVGVLCFAISDTGIGIASDAQERLFKPFEQGSNSISRLYGGSGLGLSISKNLVELMGGTIGVQSTEGQGSAFWFKIPFNSGNCQA